ncbi:TetR/AcrR family transcriptional regulator [Arthrobacter sp. Z1-15]
MNTASAEAGSLAVQSGDLRERRKRATTAEISEAALTLFEQKGVAATTVHDIAAAAGVSDRTCFRYFPSKEESVLTLHLEFGGPLAAWLDRVQIGEPPLPQLEAIYASVLGELDGPLAPVARHQLRVRRLMFHEPQLRAAAFSLDSATSWSTAQRITTAYKGTVTLEEARLVTELAGVGVRAAFNEWAEAVDDGMDATLTEVYTTVRRRLRSIADTSRCA